MGVRCSAPYLSVCNDKNGVKQPRNRTSAAISPLLSRCLSLLSSHSLSPPPIIKWLKFSRHVAYSHRSLFLTAFSIKSRQLVYSISLTVLRLLSLIAINLDRGSIQSHLHLYGRWLLELKATMVYQQQECVNMKSKTSVAIINERKTAFPLYKQ